MVYVGVCLVCLDYGGIGVNYVIDGDLKVILYIPVLVVDDVILRYLLVFRLNELGSPGLGVIAAGGDVEEYRNERAGQDYQG